MRRALQLHPDSQCPALAGISAEVQQPRPGLLALRFVVRGDIAALRLPPRAAPARTDELWRRTCFEAFVRAPAGEGYREFNLSPSTEWAAYRFDGYRQGMRPADDAPDPGVAVHVAPDRLELSAALRLPAPELAAGARLGLSAVIEAADGRVSYWAAAHPPGRADFHHADCFALEIPAPLAP